MKLAKTYEPDQYEPTIYAMWETSGVFAPKGEGKPFGIVMPPPNANGNLHIGHGFMAAIEDVLARWRRMKGDDVAYIPGADHAGFETWVVYERALEKEGRSRFDFSRDQLYTQVWNFVDSQRGNMELQLRALGVSASWDDLVFTLDDKVTSTVYKTFKKLWDEGKIYRGERIVNYCTVHQTSFADIEVDHENEKGTLWRIAYPILEKKDAEITIATTRPETLLGDVAVAVNPNDDRYKDLIGMHALLPITNREIPIIADDYVDSSYGTGAVKITPSHDPNDFEIGERHNLERITVIGQDGRMINAPDQYIGLTVDEARKKILSDLSIAELRRGESEIEHSVGHCYKCGSVIQPLLKDQWFLAVKELAQNAIRAIEAGEITFTPASRKRALVQYFENLHDWNLSRQIAWGIPIPAFQNTKDPSDWIFDERVSEFTIVVNGTTYKRDEDTFDTWFSSGQWPFITTDYLDDGKLSRFYPNSVMETGGDILYAWVAKMIMLGLHVTGKAPFKHVYLHGLVLDEKGQKMSKSKGNVINPMEMVAKHGSDAFRLGIIAARSAGLDQAFSESKVVAGRNFCNKLWNIARFIEGKLGTHQPATPTPKTLADHWIVRQLSDAAASIDSLLDDYRFAEASERVYHAIWDDAADWYIEASKTQDNPDMMAWVLDTSLKIAHPFAPFVTETIWQSLGWHGDNLLIASPWPEKAEYDDIAAAEFERLQSLVTEARFVTASLPGNEKYALLYQNDSLIADNTDLVRHLARVTEVTHTDQPRGLRLANSGREAWLDVSAETLYEHQSNLEVRLAETRAFINTLEARLSNENYIKKAPAHLVDESRKELEEKKSLAERLADELEVLA